MHPIARDYIETDLFFFQILERHKESSYLAKLMYQLRTCLKDASQAEEVLTKAKALNHFELDADMQLLFLGLVKMVMATLSPQKEPDPILNNTLKRLSHLVHPVIKSFYIIYNINNNEQEDLEGSLEQAFEEIEKNYKKSSRYRYFLDTFSQLIALQGLLEPYSQKIKKIQPLPSAYAKFVKISNELEINPEGDQEAALEEIVNDPTIMASNYLHIIQDKIKARNYLCGRREFNETNIQEDGLKLQEYDLLANLLLLSGKHEEAVNLIDKIRPEQKEERFFSYTKLRLELARKKTKTCRLFLDQRKKNRPDIMSNFYYAQIYLLEGNHTIAKAYMGKLKASVENFKCENLLDLEFRLASYLKIDQIRFLTKAENQHIQEIPLVKKNIRSTHQKGVSALIGSSKSTIQLRSEIQRFSKNDMAVLISGETGTGKELIAKALHDESNRSGEPYIAINCAAILHSILQSELFGHVEGAFTGAIKSHKGVFEAAGNGTVFLDEIGEINSDVQVALLRVLESNEILPVGSTKIIKINCRIIAATNAPLDDLVAKGKMRQDLYYRLKRLEIRTTPLRERIEDIPLLATYYLNQYLQGEKDNAKISNVLSQKLQEYPWPGNIRELKNEMEKMRIINADKLEYSIEDAPFLKITPKQIEKIQKAEKPVKEELPPTHTELIIPADSEHYLNSKNQFRRIIFLKELFKKHKRLTRDEASHALKVTSKTIGEDFKLLLKENFIEKIAPTASPRTHYFTIKEP